MTDLRSRRLLPRPALLLALALSACAPPPEADYALSERARAAPAPKLAPTERFTEPLETGAETAIRLAPEVDALAARAAALRARGAALSGSGVLDPDRRSRLEAPAPE